MGEALLAAGSPASHSLLEPWVTLVPGCLGFPVRRLTMVEDQWKRKRKEGQGGRWVRFWGARLTRGELREQQGLAGGRVPARDSQDSQGAGVPTVAGQEHRPVPSAG